jgi:hypothetical protein
MMMRDREQLTTQCYLDYPTQCLGVTLSLKVYRDVTVVHNFSGVHSRALRIHDLHVWEVAYRGKERYHANVSYIVKSHRILAAHLRQSQDAIRLTAFRIVKLMHVPCSRSARRFGVNGTQT